MLAFILVLVLGIGWGSSPVWRVGCGSNNKRTTSLCGKTWNFCMLTIKKHSNLAPPLLFWFNFQLCSPAFIFRNRSVTSLTVAFTYLHQKYFPQFKVFRRSGKREVSNSHMKAVEIMIEMISNCCSYTIMKSIYLKQFPLLAWFSEGEKTLFSTALPDYR